MQNRCYISHEKSKCNSSEENDKPKREKEEKVVYNIVTTYSQNYTWLLYLHQSESTLTNTEQIKTHDIILLRYTKNEGYLCLNKNDGRDENGIKRPYKAMVRLPLEQTGYPCYTCLWEI